MEQFFRCHSWQSIITSTEFISVKINEIWMKNFVKNNLYILTISLFNLFLHLYNNAFTSYGYFRDELYYIACSDHLATGYVDQPPFSIFVLSVNRLLFGDSLFALRILPSIANALIILLTGIIVKKFGGKTFAQLVACTAVGFAPGLLGMFGFYSMNAFDILLWLLVFYFLIQLIETEQPRLWILIGVIIGIGLMTKLSMGWLAAGIVVGVVATPMRKWLRRPFPWIAAGISFILFLPYIIWNFQSDLAHLEFAKNAAGVKYASQNVATFFSGLIMNFNPITLPIWVAGFWFFFSRRFYTMRLIGISIVIVLFILIINVHSKPEYFNPVMPILFAGGAIIWEKILRRPWLRIIGYIYLAIIGISGLIILPMAIDLLPVETFIHYSRTLGVIPKSSEGKEMASLPSHFADRFGWNELAQNVSLVYHSLSDNEKAECVIYAQNYGEASAINFFRKKLDLPLGISGHNSYWTWGYGKKEVAVVIIIGGEKENHLRVFESVEQELEHTNQYAMPYENKLPIYMCRGIKIPLEKVWIFTKHYD